MCHRLIRTVNTGPGDVWKVPGKVPGKNRLKGSNVERRDVN